MGLIMAITKQKLEHLKYSKEGISEQAIPLQTVNLKN